MNGHSLRRACLIIIIHTKRMLPGVAGGGAFTAATHAEQRCSVLRCLMHAMVPWSSTAVSCIASCMPWCHGAALQCLALPHACHGAMEQRCSVLHCLMHAMVPWSSGAVGFHSGGDTPHRLGWLAVGCFELRLQLQPRLGSTPRYAVPATASPRKVCPCGGLPAGDLAWFSGVQIPGSHHLTSE